jgi:F5/8 type C domain
MATHRYWRLYCTAGNGEPNLSLAEIQLRASLGGADETGSGTASSSGGTAANGFDNNNTTLVTTTSGAYPHWIAYDFGAGNEKDIVEIAINTRTQIRYSPTDFQLQWSDDNSAWTTLFTIEGYGQWPTGQATFLAFNADRRYTNGAANQVWRVKTTAVDGGSVFGICELMLYDSSGTNQCTGGTAFSSTQGEGGGPNPSAFDGIVTGGDTNRWSSFAVTNEWIGYKFAGAKSIITVGIVNRLTLQNQSPKDFTVQYWDGSAWQTAMTLTGITGWTSGQTRYFNASGETSAPVASARPVCFVCT